MRKHWNDSCSLCGNGAGLILQESLCVIDLDCPHCGFLRVPDGFFQDLVSTYTPAERLAVGEHLHQTGHLHTERLLLNKETFLRITSVLPHPNPQSANRIPAPR